ncbi:MAG TPA: hypothetical protein VHU84_10900 [Lacipirellulaceae bacterium]|jgi:hypothetical protein|nr:hypothetical protein [Lacipirellulaceae bacterium]
MLIDRTQRGWALLTVGLLIVASVLYATYAFHWPGGPSGRTWPGMLFGVAGTLMMIFAAALVLRKKTVRVRLGSLSWWLKGHIWFGLLSVPMILFHAAFRLGGWLEISLWALLVVVVISGVVGLAAQNVIPRMMKLQLPSEFIPDQFGEVCRRFVIAADEKIMTLCTPKVVESAVMCSAERPASIGTNPLDWLAGFHIDTIRPFLGPGPCKDPSLANGERAQLVFERVRASLPENCWATVDWLEKSCEERRQLAEQERLHRLLHGWLKVHVPCSVALAVFTVIHVITALYY